MLLRHLRAPTCFREYLALRLVEVAEVEPNHQLLPTLFAASKPSVIGIVSTPNESNSERPGYSFIGKDIYVGCTDGSLIRFTLRSDGPSTVSVT